MCARYVLFLTQSASGTYSYLPVGMRMLQKITNVIDEEMERIGASRIEMPQLLSSALWHKTGRVQAMGSELFRLKDRRGAELILAPTHEEEVTRLIGADVDSPKALPVRVYQIGRKFRDEPRPRAGLLRTKEFLMKDMYSFDASAEAAKEAYADVRGAYASIFNRVFDWSHIPSVAASAPAWREAQADTGAMGGTFSHEFHVEDAIGEDTLLSCDHCTYAANVECATSHATPERQANSLEDVDIALFTKQSDPGCVHAIVYPAWATLNPLVLGRDQLEPLSSDAPLERLCIVRDHDVALDDASLRAAVQEAVAAARPAPESLALDEPSAAAMVRTAEVGDICAQCHTGHLAEHRAMEIGHTFLLGTRYSQVLGYGVTPSGASQREPLQMGCYGIGVTRILGALAQRAMRVHAQLHPEAANSKRPRAGFVWPQGLAPFEALILPAAPHTPQKLEAAQRLAAQLDAGVAPTWVDPADDELTSIQIPAEEIAVDDRAGRTFGSSLFDAELLGYPLLFLLGKHWERTGEVEVRRAGHATRYCTIDGVCP